MTVFQSSLVLNLEGLLIFSVRDEFVGGEAIGKRDFMLLLIGPPSVLIFQVTLLNLISFNGHAFRTKYC